jgi:hypothetical protein
MRTTAFGVVVGACVTVFAMAGLGQHQQARAQRGSASEAESELVTASAMVGDKVQQLTVIDPHSRVMSVYHVDLASGTITLRSVRNITWDLQLREFNGVNPLPGEIRAMLNTR